MYSPYLHVLVGLVTSSTATNPSANFKDKCTTLANNVKLDYPFTVNVAQYLPPNATIDLAAEGRNATCIEYQMDPYPIPVGVCRFSLKVTTSNTSETYVEVWLPEKWEGRVLTTGNGGFNGCMCLISWATRISTN
jgi:feruloyl esterase